VSSRFSLAECLQDDCLSENVCLFVDILSSFFTETSTCFQVTLKLLLSMMKTDHKTLLSMVNFITVLTSVSFQSFLCLFLKVIPWRTSCYCDHVLVLPLIVTFCRKVPTIFALSCELPVCKNNTRTAEERVVSTVWRVVCWQLSVDTASLMYSSLLESHVSWHS